MKLPYMRFWHAKRAGANPEPPWFREILAAIPNHVRTQLHFMEIAEEEIRASGLPDTIHRKAGFFYNLRPGTLLQDRGEETYRAHVRELLARAKKGESASEATDTECLCAMLNTSLKAPLNRRALAVTDHLFRKLFPDKAKDFAREKEQYAGQVKEDLRVIRRTLTGVIAR